MAFLIKNSKPTQVPNGYQPVVDQFVKVSKAAATLPATTTANIFTISGGRVLVRALIGEVTTVCSGTVTNLKVTAVPTSGSATDIASNVAITSDEVGTLYSVEGDETALLENSSGFIAAAPSGGFILNVGTVRIATDATNTGAVKWDMYYTPLDPGAQVVAA